MTGVTQAESVASRNVATVYVYLRLLEEKDIDSWIELWADDAHHHYPFGTRMFPAELVGKAAVFERWQGMPAMFESLSFPIRSTWVDGDTVIAQFDSASVLNNGEKYLNTYLCLFGFDSEGKIRDYWEYFDPIIAGTAFGLAEINYLPGAANGSEQDSHGATPSLDVVVRGKDGPPRGRLQIDVDEAAVHLRFTAETS